MYLISLTNKQFDEYSFRFSPFKLVTHAQGKRNNPSNAVAINVGPHPQPSHISTLKGNHFKLFLFSFPIV